MTNDEIAKNAEEIAKKQLDSGGWAKKQYNVRIPPAQPSSHDPFGPGANPKLLENMKPIKGSAFPS